MKKLGLLGLLAVLWGTSADAVIVHNQTGESLYFAARFQRDVPGAPDAIMIAGSTVPNGKGAPLVLPLGYEDLHQDKDFIIGIWASKEPILGEDFFSPDSAVLKQADHLIFKRALSTKELDNLFIDYQRTGQWNINSEVSARREYENDLQQLRSNAYQEVRNVSVDSPQKDFEAAGFMTRKQIGQKRSMRNG